jgi:hypothetical protein
MAPAYAGIFTRSIGLKYNVSEDLDGDVTASCPQAFEPGGRRQPKRMPHGQPDRPLLRPWLRILTEWRYRINDKWTKNDIGRIVSDLEAKLVQHSGDEGLASAEDWM